MVRHKPPGLPNKQDCEEFGKVLRQLRKRKGLTQERLAETMYVSPSKISDLEANRIPDNFNPDDVGTLAEALHCSEAEYFRLYAAYLCYFCY